MSHALLCPGAKTSLHEPWHRSVHMYRHTHTCARSGGRPTFPWCLFPTHVYLPVALSAVSLSRLHSHSVHRHLLGSLCLHLSVMSSPSQPQTWSSEYGRVSLPHAHVHVQTHPTRCALAPPKSAAGPLIQSAHRPSQANNPDLHVRGFPSIPIILTGWRLGPDPGPRVWTFGSQPVPASEMTLGW